MSSMRKTVLIVDDEVYIRQSFFDYFEDRLWLPVVAQSGEEALSILDKESPHCAIVDIRMGNMDGNAFIREAHRKRPQMAFVICTGSPEYKIPDDVRKLPGVSECVFTKPVMDITALEAELLYLIAELKKKGF
jgi:DNA-binding NtrC family response regulator